MTEFQMEIAGVKRNDKPDLLKKNVGQVSIECSAKLKFKVKRTTHESIKVKG
jgi:hypothetical protein